MFGLDDWIASLSDGTGLALVALIGILLGLRHATDPDHLAAVATLVASGREATTRAAARLGLAWGAGHAVTLFAFGLPVVLFRAYLPDPVQRGAEAAIGLLIVGLAAWLLVRWRRGRFHVHPHVHESDPHTHVHDPARRHRHPERVRSPFGAFSIGLLHGIGGSAGVGVLLVATIESHVHATVALVLLAVGTAVSMTVLSTGFALTVARRTAAVAPALGTLGIAFGVWYALGALELAPYVF